MTANKHINDENNKKSIDENDITLEPSEEESGEENLHHKLKELKEKLAECSKERAEYLAGWQRARADYINLEKEGAKSRITAIDTGIERVLIDILPVLDSFELAMSDKVLWDTTPENWRKGIEHIFSQLRSIFEMRGVKEICPNPGDKIAFEHHSVVEAIPSDNEKDDGTIKAVLQKGYILKDKVLRPSQVTVFVYRNREEGKEEK